MTSTGPRDIAAAAAVITGKAAEALLCQHSNPAMVRALATRVDELRLLEPSAAVSVAEAVLKGFGRLHLSRQRPALGYLVVATYGSSLRAVARFKEAEVAFAIASQFAPRSRPDVRVDMKRRFASLRADQGQEEETRRLVASFLRDVRRAYSRTLGRELVNAAGILILIKDHRAALGYLQEAVTLLPKNGDTHHFAAVFNLASCQLELASSSGDLKAAMLLAHQAAFLIDSDSYNELKLRWLVGNLQRRLGEFQESLESLESARQGIDQRGDGYDRALLVLDIAELHLDRRDLESARALARSSFAILAVLRKDKEAYKALRVFYRAGASLALDRSIVSTCRQRLLALRRVPRRPER